MCEHDEYNFHIAEYNSVREEIMLHIKLAQNIVLFCPVVCGSIASWILTQLPNSSGITIAFGVASCIPLAFTVLSAAYHFQLLRAMYRAGDYAFILESKLSKEGLGWHEFNRVRKKNYRFRTWSLSCIAFGIQILLSAYLVIHVWMLRV